MVRRPGKTLYALVRKAFGAENLYSKLGKSVDPKIWSYLNSGKQNLENPLWRMSHNRAKLPEEHVWEWFEQTKLENLTRENILVAKHLQKFPQDEKYLQGAIKQAWFWHGVKSPFYWRESTTQDPKYHGMIAAAGEGIPLDMNSFNAKKAAKILSEEIKENGTVTLMDVGTGAGNTSRFTLQELKKLDPNALKHVHVVLNDVEPTVQKIAQEFLDLGVGRATVVPNGFFSISKALKVKGMPGRSLIKIKKQDRILLKKLKGKVNVLISFASFNNLPHSKLAFDTLHSLLAPGGHALIGDWGGYDVTKKEFTQKELERIIPTTSGARVSVRDNIKGFWRFWLYHHGFIDPASGDEKMWEKLERHIDTAVKVRPYEWFDENQNELESHREKMQRGFTYFGFANRAYRTPEDVAKSAEKSGFQIKSIEYPMASHSEGPYTKTKWSKPNPRFVTWHAHLQKRT